MTFWRFWEAYWEDFPELALQHALVVAWAIPIAVVVGLGLGLLFWNSGKVAGVAIGIASMLTTVPSVALFGLMIPILATVGLGVGQPPAILAIALYSVLPILHNAIVGLKGVPAATVDAARGLGMSENQILWRIRLPLATPAILAGVRTAVVMGIGITAIAAYVGAGGLGRWVFGGIRRSQAEMTLAGALAISGMALLADTLLSLLQTGIRRYLGMGKATDFDAPPILSTAIAYSEGLVVLQEETPRD